MKKSIVSFVGSAIVCVSVLFGCASAPKTPVASASEIDKVVVVDWTDRVLGEVAAPVWLKNMRRGNSDAFKEAWGVSADRVVNLSMATGKTEATAQALSRA